MYLPASIAFHQPLRMEGFWPRARIYVSGLPPPPDPTFLKSDRPRELLRKPPKASARQAHGLLRADGRTFLVFLGSACAHICLHMRHMSAFAAHAAYARICCICPHMPHMPHMLVCGARARTCRICRIRRIFSICGKWRICPHVLRMPHVKHVPTSAAIVSRHAPTHGACAATSMPHMLHMFTYGACAAWAGLCNKSGFCIKSGKAALG